jgi:hypothetical protein
VARKSLPIISIKTPCPAAWDKMPGDEKERHCTQCQKSVFSLKELTPFQIAILYFKKRARLCIRLEQNQEGKIIAKMPKLAQLFGGFGQSLAARFAVVFGFMLPVVGRAQELPGYSITYGGAEASKNLITILSLIEGAWGALTVGVSAVVSLTSFLLHQKYKKRFLKVLSILFFVLMVPVLFLMVLLMVLNFLMFRDVT